MKILVVRPDSIGDVILTTPVFAAIKQSYPTARVTALVQPSVAPLLTGLRTLDQLLVYDPAGEHKGPMGFWRLLRLLKRERFDWAVVIQDSRRVSVAVRAVGIPLRSGPLSKPRSYLLFNRGIRQNRSAVLRHEAEYNLDLLKPMGIHDSHGRFTTEVALSDSSKKFAREFLKSAGVNPDQPLVAIHAAMKGSALNWPESHYVELTRRLLARNFQVILTVGPGEQAVQDRICAGLGALRGKKLLTYSAESNVAGGIDKLGGVFLEADCVVAPSTGPLHLAVALRRPVVGIYPPIRVQSAVRWGPYAGEPGKTRVFSAPVTCPEQFVCQGSDCPFYDCMGRIAVDGVFGAVVDLVNVADMNEETALDV